MKKLHELENLMIELMDTIGDTKKEFNKRAREIIDEISDFAEETPLWKEQKERHIEARRWINQESAWNIYVHLLFRIAGVPTRLHRHCAVLLIMPILRQKLREEGAENG